MSLFKKYNCPIIQNNFEYPFYRVLGNKDATANYGKVNFITKLKNFYTTIEEITSNEHFVKFDDLIIHLFPTKREGISLCKIEV